MQKKSSWLHRKPEKLKSTNNGKNYKTISKLIKLIIEKVAVMMIIRVTEVGNNSKSKHIEKNKRNNQW